MRYLERLTKAQLIAMIVDLERQRDHGARQIETLVAKVEVLISIIQDWHPWARRYCDGRMTYVAMAFNKAVRLAIRWGVKLQLIDGTLWARDGMGRRYDGLTDEEAAMGSLPVTYQTPQDFKEQEDEIYRLRREVEDLKSKVP